MIRRRLDQRSRNLLISSGTIHSSIAESIGTSNKFQQEPDQNMLRSTTKFVLQDTDSFTESSRLFGDSIIEPTVPTMDRNGYYRRCAFFGEKFFEMTLTQSLFREARESVEFGELHVRIGCRTAVSAY